jgi:ABC-2 type transport system permease protein
VAEKIFRRVRAFVTAWRIALRIIGVSFRAELQYRSNFLSSIALGIAWQVSVIVFATVLLGNFTDMGGWPSGAVLLLASMRMLSHGVYALLFDRSHRLGVLVQEGRLDAFLIRPMPVYRQVQLAEFPTNALGDLLVGASMFTGAVTTIDLHWTPLRILYLTAGLIGGTLMEAAVFTALSSAHLHFPSSSAWSTWIEEIFGMFGSYPLSFLPRPVGALFTFVLPLAFIAYFPAAELTGHTDGLTVPSVVALASPAIGLGAFVAARLLWNVSLRRYTGVTG